MTIAPENVTGALAAFVMPIVSTVPSVTADTADTRRIVIDNPVCAWDESDHHAYCALDTDWVSDHRHALDEAAHDLIRSHLAAAWRERGLTVRFEDGRFHADHGNEVTPDNKTYWAVWQAASDQVTTEALLTRAGIDPNNYLRS
jgi:hypothetical protein